MNKKFLFVHLNVKTGWGNVNHGIAFLVPIIKKHSYDTACLIIDKEISCEEFRNKINNFNPAVVGFSSTSHQFKYLVKYSKAIGEYAHILQIAGGAGPTLDPDWVLSRSNVKGVCVGEGEIPLGALLTNIEKRQDIFATEGFYWYINGKLQKNLVPQFITDLTLLDFPDYTVYERSVVMPGTTLFVMLGRGCPHNCTFCCNHALKSIYPSSQGYFRLSSVEYCISLIEILTKQFPEAQFIEFEDDLLIANKSWFESFAGEYKKRITMPYRICVRVEYITADIVRAIKDSGGRKVYLGLESGNEYLRNNLLNKRFSNASLINKCNMIKESGLELFTFNIVGFPFEGRKEMQDTLRLNKKIAPSDGTCFFFHPYKGTELYEKCNKAGLLKSEAEMLEITDYTTRPSIKMTPHQEKECIYFQRKITRYLKKNRLRQELRRITANLPPGFKKHLFVLYYRVWVLTLPELPLLYRAVRKLSRLLGLKAMAARLINQKYIRSS